MGTPTMTARGGAIESINPATEEVIATFEQFTPAQVEQALAEADAAFRDWRRHSIGEPINGDAARGGAAAVAQGALRRPDHGRDGEADHAGRGRSREMRV